MRYILSAIALLTLSFSGCTSDNRAVQPVPSKTTSQDNRHPYEIISDQDRLAAICAQERMEVFREEVEEHTGERIPSGEYHFSVKVLAGENGDYECVWIELDLNYAQTPLFVGKIMHAPEEWEFFQSGQTVTQDPDLVLDWRIIGPDGERIGSSPHQEENSGDDASYID